MTRPVAETLGDESVRMDQSGHLAPSRILPQLIGNADHDLTHVSQFVRLGLTTKPSHMNLAATLL